MPSVASSTYARVYGRFAEPAAVVAAVTAPVELLIAKVSNRESYQDKDSLDRSYGFARVELHSKHTPSIIVTPPASKNYNAPSISIPDSKNPSASREILDYHMPPGDMYKMDKNLSRPPTVLSTYNWFVPIWEDNLYPRHIASWTNRNSFLMIPIHDLRSWEFWTTVHGYWASRAITVFKWSQVYSSDINILNNTSLWTTDSNKSPYGENIKILYPSSLPWVIRKPSNVKDSFYTFEFAADNILHTKKSLDVGFCTGYLGNISSWNVYGLSKDKQKPYKDINNRIQKMKNSKFMLDRAGDSKYSWVKIENGGFKQISDKVWGNRYTSSWLNYGKDFGTDLNPSAETAQRLSKIFALYEGVKYRLKVKLDKNALVGLQEPFVQTAQNYSIPYKDGAFNAIKPLNARCSIRVTIGDPTCIETSDVEFVNSNDVIGVPDRKQKPVILGSCHNSFWNDEKTSPELFSVYEMGFDDPPDFWWRGWNSITAGVQSNISQQLNTLYSPSINKLYIPNTTTVTVQQQSIPSDYSQPTYLSFTSPAAASTPATTPAYITNRAAASMPAAAAYNTIELNIPGITTIIGPKATVYRPDPVSKVNVSPTPSNNTAVCVFPRNPPVATGGGTGGTGSNNTGGNNNNTNTNSGTTTFGTNTNTNSNCIRPSANLKENEFTRKGYTLRPSSSLGSVKPFDTGTEILRHYNQFNFIVNPYIISFKENAGSPWWFFDVVGLGSVPYVRMFTNYKYSFSTSAPLSSYDFYYAEPKFWDVIRFSPTSTPQYSYFTFWDIEGYTTPIQTESDISKLGELSLFKSDRKMTYNRYKLARLAIKFFMRKWGFLDLARHLIPGLSFYDINRTTWNRPGNPCVKCLTNSSNQPWGRAALEIINTQQTHERNVHTPDIVQANYFQVDIPLQDLIASSNGELEFSVELPFNENLIEYQNLVRNKLVNNEIYKKYEARFGDNLLDVILNLNSNQNKFDPKPSNAQYSDFELFRDLIKEMIDLDFNSSTPLPQYTAFGENGISEWPAECLRFLELNTTTVTLDDDSTKKIQFRNCILTVAEEWYTTDAEPINPPGLAGNVQASIQRYDFKTGARTLNQTKPLVSAELYISKVDPNYKYSNDTTVYTPEFITECPTYRMSNGKSLKEIKEWSGTARLLASF